MSPNLIFFFWLVFLLSQSVVNLISELQEQMCKFQEEISTRIQKQQALESQGDAAAREAYDQSPDVGLGASDAEECGCRCRDGGENVGRSVLHGGLTSRPPYSLLTISLSHMWASRQELLTPLWKSHGRWCL